MFHPLSWRTGVFTAAVSVLLVCIGTVNFIDMIGILVMSSSFSFMQFSSTKNIDVPSQDHQPNVHWS